MTTTGVGASAFSLYKEPAWKNLRTCAAEGWVACNMGDGCHNGFYEHLLCGKDQAPNSCVCRDDLTESATSFIFTNVKNRCTVGSGRIEISSAIGLYLSYCSAYTKPKEYFLSFTETEEGSLAATTTTTLARETRNEEPPLATSTVTGSDGSLETVIVLGGPSSSSSGTPKSTIALAVVFPLLFLAMAAALVWWLRRRRVKHSGAVPQQPGQQPWVQQQKSGPPPYRAGGYELRRA